MKSFFKMLKIEWKLSVRDMNMVIFSIIMPIIIFVIIGILCDKMAFECADYTFIDQSFGALSTIAICAGGFMGIPILVSDYRERKILKRFKITPVSPSMILFVNFAVYTIYSLISLILLWIVGKTFFGFQMRGSYIIFIVIWLFVLMSMFSIGLLVGSIAKDTKSASVIASILYFQMLIFSGATLPYEIMRDIMQTIVDILPLTQGIKMLKSAALGLPLNNLSNNIFIMIMLISVCVGSSVKFFRWE